jgi:hypothetical protein
MGQYQASNESIAASNGPIEASNVPIEASDGQYRPLICR